MKARILLVVVALAVVLASSGSMVSAAPPSVPFKATYVTYPTTVDVTNGVLTILIPAEGQATHLGQSAWYAEMWVDTNSFPWPQGGMMVFTAANGDQLFGSYTGSAIPTDTGVDFSGSFEVTGGTGRFVGATATGAYRGSCGAETGILYFDGMLTKGKAGARLP